MKSKKDLMQELQEYNKILEKHLPNIELDYVKDLNFSKKDEDSEEYFALLANNLMELRTEMALIRKNLTTEVEGIVMKSVSEQQSKFFDQIKKFYGVIIMEVKESVSSHLRSVSEELNNLKRKYTEISVQNQNLSSLVDDALIDLKEVSGSSTDTTNAIKDMNTFSRARFDDFLERIDVVGREINKRKFYFEDNLTKLHKRMGRIENMMEEMFLEKGIDEKYKLKTYSTQEEEKMEADLIKGMENASQAKPQKKKPQITEIDLQEDDGTLDKIKEIEKKLAQLNDLRED